MSTTTQAESLPTIATIPLLKRWQLAIDTCNCPDIHEADFLTRWLVISRACVFSMTFTSGLIGVLLAASAGAFVENTAFKIWLAFLCVVGLLAGLMRPTTWSTTGRTCAAAWTLKIIRVRNTACIRSWAG